MGWRLFVGVFFLAVLTYCVLVLAYRVIPAKKTLPDTSLPPSIQAPLYGQIPDTMMWSKLPWGEEVRVIPPGPKYPQMDMSGNVLFPFD
jgi:hypothetical protein